MCIFSYIFELGHFLQPHDFLPHFKPSAHTPFVAWSSGPAPGIHNLTFELYSEASADFGGLRPVATTGLLHLGIFRIWSHVCSPQKGGLVREIPGYLREN